MREAVGSTILLYIVLFFLVVYISFMAIVINYGRVFRAKNSTISIIEQYEGVTADAQEKIKDLSYDGIVYICKNDELQTSTTNKQNEVYYNVTLEISFQLPLVSSKFHIPISGQTSAIKVPKGKTADAIIDMTKCTETNYKKWSQIQS